MRTGALFKVSRPDWADVYGRTQVRKLVDLAWRVRLAVLVITHNVELSYTYCHSADLRAINSNSINC